MALDTTDNTETTVATPPPANIPAEGVNPFPDTLVAQATIPSAIKNTAPAIIGKPDYLNTSNDLANQFNAASDNIDINAFGKLAKSDDPLIAQAAKYKLDVINKNAPLANALVNLNPTDPNDKLKIVSMYDTLNNKEEARKNGWVSTADNPKIGNALVQFLLGDKQGAVKSILGGNVKQITDFDDNGKMLVRNEDELGVVSGVYDVAQKRMISQEEYAARGGSRPLEKTLYQINRLANSTLYREAYAKDIDAQNKSSGALAEAGNKSAQMLELSKNFANLTDEQYRVAQGFTNGTFGVKQNLAKTYSLMDQATRTHNEKLDAGTGTAIAVGAGGLLGKIISYGEDNKFHVEGGESYSLSTLRQVLDQTSHSATTEQNINRSQADLQKSFALAAAKEDTPEKTLKNYAALEQYMSLYKDREAIYNNIKDKVPGFVPLPTDLAKTGDLSAKLQIGALQGQYANSLMQGFLTFKDQMLTKEKEINPNFIPEPGRYEAQWVKQPEYTDIVNHFQNETRNILNQTPKISKNTSLLGNENVGPITNAETKSANAPSPAAVPSPSAEAEKEMIKGANKPNLPPSANQAEKFHYEFSPDGKKRRKVYD